MIKEMIVAAALALGQVPAVVDGDTVKISGVRLRLTDYDSPELFSPKCPSEYARAAAANGLASPYVCHPGWCPPKRNWCLAAG